MWWIHPVEYGMANLKNQTVHEWNNLDKCHKPGVERRKSNTKKYVLYVEKSKIVTSVVGTLIKVLIFVICYW